MDVLIKALIVVVSLVVVAGLAVRFKKEERNDSGMAISVWPWGIGAAAIVFVVMLGLVLSVGQVNPGERGVVLRFGAVTERTLGEGLFFVKPFVNSVEIMDVQNRAYEAEAGAASKDLQDVHTKVTLNYGLNPAAVNRTFQTLRRDYIERIIKPAVQESVKAGTAKFTAEELITKRPDVKQEIVSGLKTRLAEHGIEAETISMTDFQFSATFTAAIESKVVAVQKAFEATNKLRQIEIEAQQAEASAIGRANAAIAEADGQKRSAILRSEGEAQALLTVANAQAEANATVNKTLTDKVIQYSLVQKLGDDIKVVVLPSGQQFILGPEVLGGK
jgi:regulator of protease activity HflC (stomatin/prohibitin superfamily)